MIELYTWTTPNGEKPVIMLEECKLAYEMHLVDIGNGEQHSDRFKAINPNEKIPALVDRSMGGYSQPVFESGAILIYLAEMAGQFLPQSSRHRSQCFSWMFFQAGHTGPMIGQYHHFNSAAPEKIDYAIERYRTESRRVLGVLDGHLSNNAYLAGDYTIADMMHYSWARIGLNELVEEGEYPSLRRWVEAIGARPAVRSGLERLQTAKDARG